MQVSSDKEDAILRMVRLFYQRGLDNAVLAPIFKKAIQDWEGHFQLVADFWSHALYGTERYKGHPFPVHMTLDFGAEAFDHWLDLFSQAAQDCLDPLDAGQAIARAKHMTHSFKAGLFPFILPDGSVSRHPPRAS